MQTRSEIDSSLDGESDLHMLFSQFPVGKINGDRWRPSLICRVKFMRVSRRRNMWADITHTNTKKAKERGKCEIPSHHGGPWREGNHLAAFLFWALCAFILLCFDNHGPHNNTTPYIPAWSLSWPNVFARRQVHTHISCDVTQGGVISLWTHEFHVRLQVSERTRKRCGYLKDVNELCFFPQHVRSGCRSWCLSFTHRLFIYKRPSD